MDRKNTKPRTKEFINMLVAEYENGVSLKELSIKYHTDAQYQFKRHGISHRSSGEQRTISRTNCIRYNWDFKEITNETEAYIAGLFMADGWVGEKQAGLKLKGSDRELVQKVRDYFSPDIKLQIDGENYAFVISSVTICNNMRNLGIKPGKTYNELAIPPMDVSLLRHFMRGYFDGDGTIFRCGSYKDTVILKCNICSPTKGILEKFRDILHSNGIHSSINMEKRRGKAMLVLGKTMIGKVDMYRLFIRRKVDIERLYHFFYDDSTIYLERKFLVFDDNRELLVYKRHVNTELIK